MDGYSSIFFSLRKPRSLFPKSDNIIYIYTLTPKTRRILGCREIHCVFGKNTAHSNSQNFDGFSTGWEYTGYSGLLFKYKGLFPTCMVYSLYLHGFAWGFSRVASDQYGFSCFWNISGIYGVFPSGREMPGNARSISFNPGNSEGFGA